MHHARVARRRELEFTLQGHCFACASAKLLFLEAEEIEHNLI